MANIYKNAKHDFTGTGNVSVYTVPENSRAIIKSLLVSDDSGSGSTLTVDLFNGDPATADKFTLFQTKALSGSETLQFLTEPLIMMENEVLQVTAANANRLFVVASILEINREDR